MTQKLDVHTVLDLIDQNLNSPGDLIDNRTPEVQMDFIGKFARLINFYDKNNVKNGNWEPFILKDPVFLTIRIANTNYAHIAKQFANSSKVSLAVYNQDDKELDLAVAVNQSFDLITDMYKSFDFWTNHMLMANDEDRLETYLFTNLKSTYAPLLWAIRSLQSHIAVAGMIKGVFIPDPDDFTDVNALIWKTNKGKTPYWDLLGIDKEDLNDVFTVLDALKTQGSKVFDFYKAVIELAKTVHADVLENKAHFPDTLLIRTFVELLENNRTEINGLTSKHLSFYYDNILKQKARGIVMDGVYGAVSLSGTKAVYDLEQAIAFNAGTDANKMPIRFETAGTTKLNPAKITGGFTLFPQVLKDQGTFLFLNTISEPNKVKRNSGGAVVPWKTFGAINTTPQELGLAFASPLLLAQSGNRTITITLTLNGNTTDDGVNGAVLDAASFYLSTAKAWLKVENVSTVAITSTVWTFEFNLSPSDPSIENFSQNPDGYAAKWPLFKIVFENIPDLKKVPEIVSIDIAVQVQNLGTLSLSNSNGALSPAKPFQLFGPIAQEGSSFYIGNPELFSKPLAWFEFSLNWDKLPNSFETYYDVYNLFLQKLLVPNEVATAFEIVWKYIKQILSVVTVIPLIPKFFQYLKKRKAKKQAKEAEAGKAKIPLFSNQAFKIGFTVLKEDAWGNVVFTRQRDCVASGHEMTCESPYIADDDADYPNLFNATDAENTKLSGVTDYKFTASDTNKWPYDVAVQNENPKLTDKSTAGFLQMELLKPPYGFGHSLYPQVVSKVALVNANAIVQATKGSGGKTPLLIDAPNAPFIPTVKSIDVNYYAQHTYTLTYANTAEKLDEVNPIQLYHYGLYSNYLVYDNTTLKATYQNEIGLGLVGNPASNQGVVSTYPQLYPGFGFDGSLMVESVDVIADEEVTYMVELSNRPFSGQERDFSVEFFCLTANGWLPITVLNDETNGLTCSGLLKLQFPAQMVDNNSRMPKGYWWGVGLTGDPNAVAEMVCIKTNGVEFKRLLSTGQSLEGKPVLGANQIKSPIKPIPEIASVSQPFPSFGGKAAESTAEMNGRVSNRLKTKDRVVTAGDCARMIYQKFDTVFYSKVNYSRSNRTVDIRLVKRVNSVNDANAFLPLVSKCLEDQVKNEISASSGFSNLSVTNFDLKYVVVNATVYVSSAYDLKATSKRLTQALKVFLSPWIDSDQNQIQIDQGITDVQVSQFLTDFNEVVRVEGLNFELSTENIPHQPSDGAGVRSISTADKNLTSANLIVPRNKQNIKWKPAM